VGVLIQSGRKVCFGGIYCCYLQSTRHENLKCRTKTLFTKDEDKYVLVHYDMKCGEWKYTPRILNVDTEVLRTCLNKREVNETKAYLQSIHVMHEDRNPAVRIDRSFYTYPRDRHYVKQSVLKQCRFILNRALFRLHSIA
jgi:hypothetical protein